MIFAYLEHPSFHKLKDTSHSPKNIFKLEIIASLFISFKHHIVSRLLASKKKFKNLFNSEKLPLEHPSKAEEQNGFF